jgi:hypothetical protein
MHRILFARCDAAETFGVAADTVGAVGGTVEVWDIVEADPPDRR